MTICAKCKHSYNWSRGASWLYAVCKASNYTISPLTGKREYRRCVEINYGNCRLFEPRETLAQRIRRRLRQGVKGCLGL